MHSEIKGLIEFLKTSASAFHAVKNVCDALDENGYIISDETTKTNLPGVFSVGDVRTKPVRQIATAVADGATVSHFIEEHLMEIE